MGIYPLRAFSIYSANELFYSAFFSANKTIYFDQDIIY